MLAFISVYQLHYIEEYRRVSLLYRGLPVWPILLYLISKFFQ